MHFQRFPLYIGFKNIASAAGRAGEINYISHFKAQLYEHEIRWRDPGVFCSDMWGSSFGSGDCFLAVQKLDLGGVFMLVVFFFFFFEKWNCIRGLRGPELYRS
jgi:hypothetical protein